jgi:hypothetical protein
MLYFSYYTISARTREREDKSEKGGWVNRRKRTETVGLRPRCSAKSNTISYSVEIDDCIAFLFCYKDMDGILMLVYSSCLVVLQQGSGDIITFGCCTQNIRLVSHSMCIPQSKSRFTVEELKAEDTNLLHFSALYPSFFRDDTYLSPV